MLILISSFSFIFILYIVIDIRETNKDKYAMQRVNKELINKALGNNGLEGSVSLDKKINAIAENYQNVNKILSEIKGEISSLNKNNIEIDTKLKSLTETKNEVGDPTNYNFENFEEKINSILNQLKENNKTTIVDNNVVGNSNLIEIENKISVVLENIKNNEIIIKDNLNNLTNISEQVSEENQQVIDIVCKYVDASLKNLFKDLVKNISGNIEDLDENEEQEEGQEEEIEENTDEEYENNEEETGSEEIEEIEEDQEAEADDVEESGDAEEVIEEINEDEDANVEENNEDEDTNIGEDIEEDTEKINEEKIEEEINDMEEEENLEEEIKNNKEKEEIEKLEEISEDNELNLEDFNVDVGEIQENQDLLENTEIESSPLSFDSFLSDSENKEEETNAELKEKIKNLKDKLNS